MQLRNWSLTCSIFWKEGRAMTICQTRVMRPALIFLVSIAATVQSGVAQAPGTLDPSKINLSEAPIQPGTTDPGSNRPLLPPAVSTQTPAQPSSAPSTQPGATQPSATAQNSEDFKIVTGTTVVIAPTTVRDRNGEFVNGLQLQDF